MNGGGKWNKLERLSMLSGNCGDSVHGDWKRSFDVMARTRQYSALLKGGCRRNSKAA